jgi:hypothetical protein
VSVDREALLAHEGGVALDDFDQPRLAIRPLDGGRLGVDLGEDALDDERPVDRDDRASTPKRFARRTVRATTATWTSIFEGMQPRLRHVPPKGLPSTTATRQPRCAAVATTSPPEPAPVTMRSNTTRRD